MDICATVGADLSRIRSTRPLIHHITNFVVMNETANLTLALGALPVMAHAREEVEEMAVAAGALVLNIGTLWPELVDAMILAGKAANEAGVPVVLDPVGVGATALRTDSARWILDEVDVSVIRGNLAEVSILAGRPARIAGVESIASTDDASTIAIEAARLRGCVAVVTGPSDAVSDGTRTVRIDNGDEMLTTITGTGCMSTTVVGGFLAVQPDPLVAATEALAAFGIAAERAAVTTGGSPGSFHVALYDELSNLDADDLESSARVRVDEVRVH